MKYTNLTKMTLAAGLAIAAVSCSDYNDYNRVPMDTNPAANKTIYQNIVEHGKLNDFAAIIDKVGYSGDFEIPQYYTLWAPLDGTYDAKAVMAQKDSVIINDFIQMHLAQYAYAKPNAGDSLRIITLNEKHHSFNSQAYDGRNVVDNVIPSTNGLIYTINGKSDYHPNIYQYLGPGKGCDSLVSYIRKYDINEIDKNKSVEGPMVNGQQTYLDIVYRKRNPVISNIMNAEIADEDSTFTVLLPTDEAWDKAIKEISPLYNYISPLNYMDMEKTTAAAGSIKATDGKAEQPVQIDVELYKDSLPKSSIVRNLAFSNSYRQNTPLVTGRLGELGQPDTLIRFNGRHSVATKLSNVAEILANCGERVDMSNGYVRPLNSFCFQPWETYNPIRTANIVRWLGLKDRMTPTVYQLTRKDMVENHWNMISDLPDYIKTFILPKDTRFFSYIATDSINMAQASSKPELDFSLDNVLANRYHIYVVLAPSQLLDPTRPVSTEGSEVKNLYLRFDMSYTAADGTQKYDRLSVPGGKKTDDILIVNDGKFHFVELVFDFPICYYGLEAYPTLFMSLTKSFTSSANRRKFEQELRVAGVFLVPDSAYEYVKSLKFE